MLENELFTLLQNTSDAAFSVTSEGEIMSWNKAAEGMVGYSAAEAVHKTCYDILEGMGPLGTRVCHQHCSVAECAGANAEIPNFDMSVKTRSGERLWINISTLVFDNKRRYLFYSNRRPEDAPFIEALQMLEKSNPNFQLICTMSEMLMSHKEWKGEKGLIGKEMLSRYLINLRDRSTTLPARPPWLRVCGNWRCAPVLTRTTSEPKNSQGTEARPICRKSVRSSDKKFFRGEKHAGKQA